MKRIIFFLFIGLQFLIVAQPKLMYKDTSYTPYNVFIKEVIEYPFIKIVKPILPDSVNAQRNITYVSYGNRDLTLDIFSKSIKNKSQPAIILVHGGGWRTGNKSNLFPIALKISDNGFVAVTIEYRLAYEKIFPAAVIDIKNSVKWLKKNAGNYNVDTNKISILGCSAGGQLASLVGFSNNEKEFEDNNFPGISSNINAVINIDGLMDFFGKGSEEFDEKPDPQKPRAAHQWLGASQIERPDLWKKASPIHYIKKNSSPILFINSSNPRFSAGRDEAIKTLNQLGIYNELHTFENTPHPFWLFHPWHNKTVDIVISFLNKVN